jgi:DNA-binding transcriptional LysR family regulator
LGVTRAGPSNSTTRWPLHVSPSNWEATQPTSRAATTDEGQQLYDQVRPHLTGVSEAVALASGAAHAVRGKLRVNIDAFFARVFLASRLTEFLDRFPELSVELITQGSLGDLVADRFDLAVRFVDPPAGGSLVARRLTDTRILTVASPGYIARHGRPKHPKDVVQHKRILFPNPLTSRPFEWEFKRGRELVEIPVEGHLTVSDAGTMLDACVAGAGIAQILELGTEGLLQTKQLVNLFPDWSGERWPLYALYPSRRFQPAKLKAFVDFCVANISTAGRPSNL